MGQCTSEKGALKERNWRNLQRATLGILRAKFHKTSQRPTTTFTTVKEISLENEQLQGYCEMSN